jgi:hypothetical protein
MTRRNHRSKSTQMNYQGNDQQIHPRRRGFADEINSVVQESGVVELDWPTVGGKGVNYPDLWLRRSSLPPALREILSDGWVCNRCLGVPQVLPPEHLHSLANQWVVKGYYCPV